MKQFIKGRVLLVCVLSLFLCLGLFQSNAQEDGVDTISYPVDGSLTLIQLGDRHILAVCSGDKKDCTIRSKH